MYLQCAQSVTSSWPLLVTDPLSAHPVHARNSVYGLTLSCLFVHLILDNLVLTLSAPLGRDSVIRMVSRPLLCAPTLTREGFQPLSSSSGLPCKPPLTFGYTCMYLQYAQSVTSPRPLLVTDSLSAHPVHARTSVYGLTLSCLFVHLLLSNLVLTPSAPLGRDSVIRMVSRPLLCAPTLTREGLQPLSSTLGLSWCTFPVLMHSWHIRCVWLTSVHSCADHTFNSFELMLGIQWRDRWVPSLPP
jgi:hypothetical protein